jgi:putative membrane protein
MQFGLVSFGLAEWSVVIALSMVFGVALIVWLILWLTTRRHAGASTTSLSWSALAILEEHYANGEIDQNEYLQRKANLEGWGS